MHQHARCPFLEDQSCNSVLCHETGDSRHCGKALQRAGHLSPQKCMMSCTLLRHPHLASRAHSELLQGVDLIHISSLTSNVGAPERFTHQWQNYMSVSVTPQCERCAWVSMGEGSKLTAQYLTDSDALDNLSTVWSALLAATPKKTLFLVFVAVTCGVYSNARSPHTPEMHVSSVHLETSGYPNTPEKYMHRVSTLKRSTTRSLSKRFDVAA